MAKIFNAFRCDCCKKLVNMDEESYGYFKTGKGGKEYFLCQNCSDSLARKIPTPECYRD